MPTAPRCRQQVGVEAGVVEQRAQALAVARAAHVHPDHVPAARVRESPGRDDVGRGVAAAEAVEDQERRAILARARLP
mgnify:CR=1 FL=1